MKSILLAATAMLTFTAATAASATIIPVTFGPVGADGSFSGTFSDNAVTASPFTDTFTFTLPTGLASSSVSSVLTSPANNINFTSVTLNGSAFGNSSSGNNESRFVDFLPVSAGTQTLVVSGSSGGNGSFSGTIAFSPIAAVPEPASWALMMLGFGGLGGVLRTQRRQRPAVSA